MKGKTFRQRKAGAFLEKPAARYSRTVFEKQTLPVGAGKRF